jgi:stage IV sporulation protein FB
MRLFSIGRTEIRLHPLVILVIAGACVLGRLYDLLQAMLALTLHEVSHAAAAAAFGCRVNALELMPFGGVARIQREDAEFRSEWCVAAAGPLISLVLAGVTALIFYISPFTGARMQSFLNFNLVLGMMNLLPALPLDGGRIVKCALTPRIGLSRAIRITAWTGVGLGLFMLGLSIAAAILRIYNLTLPVMGSFLLMAAIGELRSMPEQKLMASWGRSAPLPADGLSVHQVAALNTMTGREALRLMRENRFTVLRVVDRQLHSLGELDEGALVTGLARLGLGATVEDLLKFDRRSRLC